MPSVTINGVNYTSYVDLADADTYLAAQIEATSWATATNDQRGIALVTMSRIIDRQIWQGSPVDFAANGAFPRNGIVYPDGTPVPNTVVPQEIINGVCEGASLLLNGSPLQDSASTFNPQKSIKAGSVEIVNFRQVGPQPRFPPQVQELVGFWLGGGDSGLMGSVATGTCGESIMDRRYNVNQGF